MDYDDERAEAYDRRHAQRFAEADVTADLLAGLVEDRAGASVLELGIGTGRLALPLAARGFEVHGIDSSPAMVDRLRAKPGGADLPVVIGDFVDVGSLVDGAYDLVLLPFNALFELLSQDEQCRCLAGAAAHLAPGGALVVEALAPELTRLEQSLTVTSLAADEVVLQATSHDPVTQVVRGHDVVLTETAPARLRPWAIRYATVPEIDLMARLAGLERRERWGGWQREPYTAESARHVSVYARPPGVVGSQP
ncbi:MAG TPA: class I SAM-dependent methyltransferase [Acidimicrobiales bacterium]|nr:class I SAM-dependent methyltransferase [Acidimicrobiales bacterium]